MRRLIVLAAAATARAQLTEFSSHIVLTGFDVERLDIFLIVFFVILFVVFNVMAFLVYQKRKREREEDGAEALYGGDAHGDHHAAKD